MEDIAHYIKRGAECLTEKDIEALAFIIKQQPYWQAAHMLYVHALYLHHAPRYGEVLRNTAISIPDRTALWNAIERRNLMKQEHTPRRALAGSDRTESLITGFLDTLPQEKTRPLTVADAATDYIAYMLQTENSGESSNVTMAGQQLIDDFIDKRDGQRIVLTERDEDEMLTPEIQENDEFFTETMARIYIKQGKYDKAIKIIESLSTKVPRKSAYFADQMRFLNLLIENNKYNKQ